ncbi:lipopolysaccharide assembly protein LapA domain-containing protein [Candidatus Laterigemmans baculatus]|uniref:lipopolysaccharide assembly protein LapA domain-containing protein n=1 Tax=Candidatus Laterigemmans baculatus TaxID=2770505 RepID=UPI0013DD094A|nr:LapA family protein [Candidatus Laterigemmans baculatus]
MWQKTKLVLVVIALMILLIAVFQNTAATKTAFLFYEFTLPQAALIFLAAGVGFVLGVITTSRILRRKKPRTG